MFHYYKLILLALLVLLPYMIFIYRNKFDNAKRTILRAVLAIFSGWVFLLISRVIIVALDLLLANSPDRIQDIYDGDGAKNVTVLLFWWVIPSVLVLIFWLFHKSVNLIKGCRAP